MSRLREMKQKKNTQPFICFRYKEPARKDRSKHRGGLLVYVKEDIPSCLLKDHSDLVVIGLNFRKQKWLLLSIYISSINQSLFYEQMSSVIEIIVIGYEIRNEGLTLTNYRIQMWTRRNSGNNRTLFSPKI